ncbi:site-specific integrase [Xanthomonas sp. SHU 308]|uniref:tyrosine-type recombinase/integrase n=1 Tax=Xanthomonas sp. SHU 308 TaxID=1591201 RepID=UPI0005BD3FD5|nr:site-specific integrase [Xanthomonas sp. SHU 308]
MARTLHRLSATFVRSAIKGTVKPGRYTDGGNLALRVGGGGAVSWTFEFVRAGKRRELGLGSAGIVGLAEARARAAQFRVDLAAGIVPSTARARSQASIGLTFAQATEKYLASKVSAFKNDKHKAQWRNTLETYAHPVFGALDVKQIDTPHVLAALEPIWLTKNETASRVRGRIERVLAWATVNKHRSGENPARWRGHLSEALAAPAQAKRVQHHAALPYSDLPQFMADLAQQVGTGAAALRFAILTATRTSEVLGACWGEFDLQERTWVIPAERMKAGKEHRVPLSRQAAAVLMQMQEFTSNDAASFVFPGAKPGASLSNMAMLSTLKRMGRSDLTTHGFRSSFRDWAGQETHHPREVIEHALAHQLKDKAEAAYARGDLLKKRRVLMEDWSAFASPSE